MQIMQKEKFQKKFRAVLFDKDGVLLDSIDTCLTAINDTLKHYDGNEVTKEEFKRIWWGIRADINIAKRFEGAPQSKVDEIYDYYNNKKLEFKNLTKIYSSTIPVLESLKGKYRLGVVTSSTKEVATELLKEFGILEYFDVLVGGKDAIPKPAPDSILKACKLLGVTPEETLYVGDTLPDVEAGQAAGCSIVIVTTSMTREELKDVDGVTIIDDLRELEKFLGLS